MHSSIPTNVTLLTAQQAAKALAISPRTLWGMTASGGIPHMRIGRSVRYPVGDLHKWIDDQNREVRHELVTSV
jgi:excisionase family DNA binding protein